MNLVELYHAGVLFLVADWPDINMLLSCAWFLENKARF